MNVRELYQREYGVICDEFENPETDTVGTTVVQLLKNDAGRLNYYITNLGSTAIYLAFTSDVSATKGHYLAANGGYVSLDWRTDGVKVTRPLYAVSTGSCKVYLTGLRISPLTPGAA